MIHVLEGDARLMLRTLPAASVHCVVTSPPYYGLRDYGTVGQLGLESTPSEYVVALVGVFAEVRRVLRKDGTVWLNIGDSYAGSGKGPSNSLNKDNPHAHQARNAMQFANGQAPTKWLPIPAGLKAKDLIGVPWMLAFALRDDGWYLRSDIIWSKPNPMPESVQDRPTRAHEYLFLLSKSRTYYYDADAIAEDSIYAGDLKRTNGNDAMDAGYDGHRTRDGFRRGIVVPATRNKRSVWEIATEPFPEAHFATYPTALVEPCIKAGSPVGGTVLDPFCGAGTTLLVADRLQRDAVGIELNPTYAAMTRRRLTNDAPMFVEVV